MYFLSSNVSSKLSPAVSMNVRAVRAGTISPAQPPVAPSPIHPLTPPAQVTPPPGVAKATNETWQGKFSRFWNKWHNVVYAVGGGAAVITGGIGIASVVLRHNNVPNNAHTPVREIGHWVRAFEVFSNLKEDISGATGDQGTLDLAKYRGFSVADFFNKTLNIHHFKQSQSYPPEKLREMQRTALMECVNYAQMFDQDKVYPFIQGAYRNDSLNFSEVVAGENPHSILLKNNALDAAIVSLPQTTYTSSIAKDRFTKGLVKYKQLYTFIHLLTKHQLSQEASSQLQNEAASIFAHPQVNVNNAYTNAEILALLNVFSLYFKRYDEPAYEAIKDVARSLDSSSGAHINNNAEPSNQRINMNIIPDIEDVMGSSDMNTPHDTDTHQHATDTLENAKEAEGAVDYLWRDAFENDLDTVASFAKRLGLSKPISLEEYGARPAAHRSHHLVGLLCERLKTAVPTISSQLHTDGGASYSEINHAMDVCAHLMNTLPAKSNAQGAEKWKNLLEGLVEVPTMYGGALRTHEKKGHVLPHDLIKQQMGFMESLASALKPHVTGSDQLKKIHSGPTKFFETLEQEGGMHAFMQASSQGYFKDNPLSQTDTSSVQSAYFTQFVRSHWIPFLRGSHAVLSHTYSETA
jgi:hypothetical protein